MKNKNYTKNSMYGDVYFLWKSVKYRYIEFFAFDYDSLPISFQSGIAVFL